jgi:hypothetical protein
VEQSLADPTYVGLDRGHSLPLLPTLLTTLTTILPLVFLSLPLYSLPPPPISLRASSLPAPLLPTQSLRHLVRRLAVQTADRCRATVVWYAIISPYLAFGSHARVDTDRASNSSAARYPIRLFPLLDHLDNGPNSSSRQHRCTPRSCCSTEKIGRSLKRNSLNSPFSISFEWRAPAEWIHGIHEFFNLCCIPLPLFLCVCIVIVSPFTRVPHGTVPAYLPVQLQLTRPFSR